MDESSAAEGADAPREPDLRHLPRRGFRVWVSNLDGEAELRADVGVSAEQLSSALSRYLPVGVRLAGVEPATDDQGAVLLRFRYDVPPAGRSV
jgi:hypothetical protein